MFAPKQCRALLVSFCAVMSSFSVVAMQITEANMRQASRDLTEKEAYLVKTYIQNKIDFLKQNPHMDPQGAQGAKLDALFKEFYRNRYDLVLQDMYAIGDNPQSILQTSQLRTEMLAGKLEHTPWFLREIAGLDWFFERDSKRSRKQWPKPQDKLVYIMSLADEMIRNHQKVFNADLIRDAIDSLEKHMNLLLISAPKTFKGRVAEALSKLQNLRASYAKQGDQ